MEKLKTKKIGNKLYYWDKNSKSWLSAREAIAYYGIYREMMEDEPDTDKIKTLMEKLNE